MHRCSNSQGNMVGQCSCGMFQCQCQCQNHNSSSSWLFSMPNHTSYDETNMYPFMSSSSSSVDCTLSLGTPSTRLCEDDDNKHIRSNYCWDLLQQNNNAPSYNSHQPTKVSRGSNGNSSNSNSSGNDTLLARRCANCDTTSTPLWRNGPRGPKSLCNACGIRFKKEERRATAANANNSSVLEQQQQYHGYDYDYQHNNSWVNHHSQNQKMSCFSPLNEFRFIEDNDRDSDTGMPYLSWRLNVADRPASLVHDFTR